MVSTIGVKHPVTLGGIDLTTIAECFPNAMAKAGFSG